MEEPTKFDSFLIGLWRWTVVAASGYLVAGVFLFALFFLDKYRRELNPATQLMLAAVIAGPLALAFIWRRLGRVKVFEIEIDLARATPLTDDTLTQGLISVESMSAGPSYDKIMTQQILKALRSNTAELLQVDLGKEPGWWSTRLFLLAALAEDYTRIRQLVFLDSSGRNEPLFIGMSTPTSVRRVYATKHRMLEAAYGNYDRWHARGKISLEDEVGWVIGAFGGGFGGQPETTIKEDVTPASLQKDLSMELGTGGIDWNNYPVVNRLLLYRILNCEAPYVALLEGRRLLRIVNRSALTMQIARSALEQHLQSE